MMSFVRRFAAGVGFAAVSIFRVRLFAVTVSELDSCGVNASSRRDDVKIARQFYWREVVANFGVRAVRHG